MKLPKRMREKSTATNLGTKDRVCSWTWVVAWRTLMMRPTIMAMRRMGREAFRVAMKALRMRSRAMV